MSNNYPFVLVKAPKLRETLLEFGFEYDDDDIEIVFESDQGGIYQRIPSLDIHVFKIAKKRCVIVPIIDIDEYDDYDAEDIQKIYFNQLKEVKDDPFLVEKFKQVADRLLDANVFRTTIPARKFEDSMEVVPSKVGFEDIHIVSYLISQDLNGEDVLEYDVRTLFALCNQAIDNTHFKESLTPSKNKNILVTLFYKNDNIAGIRTTKLISGKRAQIMGAFACSSGYGMILQQHTENLLRQYQGMFFPNAPLQTKPITFQLSALPSAQGFWERVGFVPIGKKDDEDHTVMQKQIYPDDERSIISTKKKRSNTSPGITSKKRIL